MRDFHNTENRFVGYGIIILQCELRKDELAIITMFFSASFYRPTRSVYECRERVLFLLAHFNSVFLFCFVLFFFPFILPTTFWQLGVHSIFKYSYIHPNLFQFTHF